MKRCPIRTESESIDKALAKANPITAHLYHRDQDHHQATISINNNKCQAVLSGHRTVHQEGMVTTAMAAMVPLIIMPPNNRFHPLLELAQVVPAGVATIET